MKPYALILFVALLFSGCSNKEEQVDVEALNKEFIDAWNDEDADKVVSMLADDVDFLQGEVHYSGKSEVADEWVEATIGTIEDLDLKSVSTGVGENIAYEGGTFSVDVLPTGPGQPAGKGEGNYMLLWKKVEDGTWKLSYAQLEDLPVVARN